MNNRVKLSILTVLCILLGACAFTEDESATGDIPVVTYNKESVGKVKYVSVNGSSLRNLEQDLLEVTTNEYVNKDFLTLDFKNIEGLEVSFPEVVAVTESGVRAWMISKNNRLELPRPRKFLNHEDEPFFTIEELTKSLEGVTEANLVITDSTSSLKKIVIRIRDIPRDVNIEVSSTEEAFRSNDKLAKVFHTFEHSGVKWYLMDVFKVVNPENIQIFVNVVNQQNKVNLEVFEETTLLHPQVCHFTVEHSGKSRVISSNRLRFAKLDNSTFKNFDDNFLEDSYVDSVNPGEKVFYGIYLDYDIHQFETLNEGELVKKNMASHCDISCSGPDGWRWIGLPKNFVDYDVGLNHRDISVALNGQRIEVFYSSDSIATSFSSNKKFSDINILKKSYDYTPTSTYSFPKGKRFIPSQGYCERPSPGVGDRMERG